MGEALVVVVQARVGSSRLPGKVLAEVAGRPMLRFQLDRLQDLVCDHLVVATSDLAIDDAIAELAVDVGAAVVRGSESDVLGRFGAVLERYDPHDLVRLTGDCPLSDPSVVADVVSLHRDSAADYTSNVHPRSFPKGLDVEVMTASALRTALTDAVDPYEREHVTPYLYRHPELFSVANLDSGQDAADLWWTVDTPEDLERIRDLVKAVDDPVRASWTAIWDAIRGSGPIS